MKILYRISLFFLYRALLLLSAFVASHSSSFCSLLSRPHPSSPSPSFDKLWREGAVLHLFNELHNYHINFSSLLITFEVSDKYQPLRKARAVCWWPSPLEEVGRRFLISILFIRCYKRTLRPIKLFNRQWFSRIKQWNILLNKFS